MKPILYLDDDDTSIYESFNIETEKYIQTKPQKSNITHRTELTLETLKKFNTSRARPIVKKSTYKPIKLTRPINKYVFATYDDYLAALESN